ncbi:MAG TPA: RDD family protein [Pyrinomonadaceae bacterium]|nr:RDD family protein [Pyrinomonadaceae bacterium]
MPEVSSDLPLNKVMAGRSPVESSASDQSRLSKKERSNSTLIEFPGVGRAIPEWRKQLSQRVREVQDQRAREAAEAAAAAQEGEMVSCALPSAQLELVPDREQQVMNPIVSKALERLERARRSDFAFGVAGAAAATALAPVADAALEAGASISPSPKTAARKSKLVVVPPKPAADEPRRKPVRVISDSIENAALSYLETCLSVPALASDIRADRAGLGRRMIAGLLDLLVVALLLTPIAAGIEFAEGLWSDPRVIGLMGGIALVLMFSYLTVSIALTGRTLGLRLLSLRTIDVRTGLIPTGGQSMKRAVGYIFSLATFGLGIVYALIDSDGRTIHDRFSKTIVVQTNQM